MTVILLLEWDNANEETRLKKYRETVPKRQKFWQKKIEEGIVKNMSGGSDITRHMIGLVEFENWDAFAKVYSDEEFQMMFVELCHLVDNLSYRLLRPGITIPP